MSKNLLSALVLSAMVLLFSACGGGGGSSPSNSNIDNVMVDPQAYYIDTLEGNDANDGKTPQTAWKSLTKPNSIKINAGNKLLFRTGQTWQGQLKIKDSGTVENPIEIGSYGDGAQPIIKAYGVYKIGQNEEEIWHKYSDSYVGSNAKDEVKDPQNTWYFYSSTLEAHPQRIKVNGKEVLGAYYGGELDDTFKWHYNVVKSGQVFYWYGNDKPSKIETNLYPAALNIKTATNVKISNIELQGGYIAALFVNDSSHISVSSCKIGDMSKQGVYVKAENSTATGINIDHCIIDSKYTLDYSSATGPEITSENGYIRTPTTRGAPEGIMFWGGIQNSVISSNTIKNWTHANVNLSADNEEQLIHNSIHDNELLAPDIAYGGRLAIDGKNAANNEVYGNKIHDIKAPNQFNGHDNIFHDNNVSNIYKSVLKPAETGYGIVVQAYSSPVYNNSIINNTFKNIANDPIFISDINNYNVSNITTQPNTFQ